MADGRLEGKVAIITGAARGQGACEARLFVEEGARVVLGDIMDEEGEALAEELGDAARYVHLDVREETDWAGAVEAAGQFGALNVLINNAAVVHFSAISETTLEDFNRVVSINQTGTFLGMRSVFESMKAAGGGSIVNVSSIDGLQAKNGIIAYASTKWAIRGMTKVAAIEFGRHNIRVNSLHPGGVDTIMGNPASMDNIDEFYKDQPIPRCGQPIDIARLALFMASDECSYSTGAEFIADGGWHAGDFERFLPHS
ncbi:MAG: SDR family oxidoreductase [Myxococcota bacterium]|nr:SDR family oxidoreductase [Myxococcota bacterium]